MVRSVSSQLLWSEMSTSFILISEPTVWAGIPAPLLPSCFLRAVKLAQLVLKVKRHLKRRAPRPLFKYDVIVTMRLPVIRYRTWRDRATSKKRTLHLHSFCALIGHFISQPYSSVCMYTIADLLSCTIHLLSTVKRDYNSVTVDQDPCLTWTLNHKDFHIFISGL